MLRQLFLAIIQTLFLLAWCHLAVAQSNIVGGGMFGDAKKTASTYQGPGDVVSGASAWYGLRAYNASYAASLGNLADIVDTNTGLSTCTITSLSNGKPNLSGTLCPTSSPTVSVTTFCTITHVGCSITKLYDQTGNAFHVAQATLANMPTLTLNCINGEPCLVGSAVANLTYAANFTSLSQPYTISIVANRTANFTTSQDLILSNSFFQFRQVANTLQMFAGTAGVTIGSITDVNFHAFQAVFNGASSILFCGGSAGTNCSISGTSNSLSPGTNVFGGTSLSLFTASCTSCEMTEVGVWPSGFTGTQQTNVTANEYNYYGPF